MSNKEKIINRPPIITIAGHIDHGKTTLLKKLIKENIKTEHGGITQHINGYNIKTKHGNMTFIDTPGHSAFNSIRIKSIQCSDIMILVLAIDDGVQPQTIESIETAKKYNIATIVCINKIDKEIIETKKEKTINDLAKLNLIQEKWGGDTFYTYISAKTGEGIDNLIDVIHTQSEILDLKTNINDNAKGIILDNKIDAKIGNITSLIIKSGKLKKGDLIKTKNDQGKIKIIMENDKVIDEATPSMCVNVIGLQNKQEIGDSFTCINKKSDKIQETKKIIVKEPEQKIYTMDDMIKKMTQKDEKKINIIIKADVQGSLDVLNESIKNLSVEKIKINIIKSDLGIPNYSDIELAYTTKSYIIGFNIKIPQNINKIIKNKNIKIASFNVIYDILEYLNKIIKDYINLAQKENILGIAEVKKVFSQEKDTIIAGCIITQGKIKSTSQIKIIRKNNTIYNGFIESIKVFKNSVNEVNNGMECGIIIKDYKNIQISDKIKAYTQCS